MARSRPAPRRRRRRLDFGSLAAIPLAIAIVLVGQAIEGGAVRSLLQGASALIVLGGTFGALMISYSPVQVVRALREAWGTFFVRHDDSTELATTLVALAIRAHRKGVMALDADIDGMDDPFLRNGLTLLVDGGSPENVKEMLVIEQHAKEGAEDMPARVWEAAAGYAPTLGILGAVLGLIQVMEHLSAPGALGSGIAIAFVSTVYGVGFANLVFLPIAARLRERSAHAARRRELIAEGLSSIAQRLNPRIVALRLRPFAEDAPRVEEIAARVGLARSTPRRLA